MGEVVTIAAYKGGAGKTTSTANLAVALVERGHRVLAVDADPQAHLTLAFGCEESTGSRLEDVLANPHRGAEGSILRQVDGRPIPGGVHVLPASIDLADVAADVAEQDGYETRLRDVLAPLLDTLYDYVLIDTPPALGVLGGLALLAADRVLVCARPAAFDLHAAGALFDVLEGDAADANPRLDPIGVLLTQVDRRWRISRRAREDLDAAGIEPLPVMIPQSIRVAEAPSHGAPSFVLEPDGRVAEAYRRLAGLIAGRSARAAA